MLLQISVGEECVGNWGARGLVGAGTVGRSGWWGGRSRDEWLVGRSWGGESHGLSGVGGVVVVSRWAELKGGEEQRWGGYET